MIAIGYIRVSTDDQAENGVSLDMQIRKIKEYCALHDIPLGAIYGDPGISGKSIDIRPGLQTIINMVQAKKIDHIIVYKLDRLARKAIDTLHLAELFDKYGTALHSITDKIDTKSAIGRLFFTLQAALAEFERNLIAERTQAAMNHKKQNGEKVSSRAPYGYDFDKNGKIIINDKEQECLKNLQALHSQYPKASYRKLAKLLESRGYTNRNGKRFDPASIKAMLTK